MASSQDHVGRVIQHKDYFLRGGDLNVLVSPSAVPWFIHSQFGVNDIPGRKPPLPCTQLFLLS